MFKSGVICLILLVGDIGFVFGWLVVGLIFMMFDLICSILIVVVIVLVGFSCWFLLKKEFLVRFRMLNIVIMVLVFVVIFMMGIG